MVEHQGPRRHAACKIIVHGMQDVTERLNPYLISVQVTDSVEGGHSQAHIELDDRYCELVIPPDDVPLTVMMGWAGEGPRVIDFGRGNNSLADDKDITAATIQNEMKWDGPGLEVVFAGWVSEVESGFGRKGGGRRLWISGTGGNTKGQAKEQQTATVGEGKKDDSEQAGEGKHKLEEIGNKVFGAAGLQFKMSPGMKKLKRDFWQATNESAQMFGERMARETGGIFSINNGIATLVGKGEGVNADGVVMFPIEAVWGVNLIGWRIKPFSGRPQYGGASARFFDFNAANWDKVAGEIGGGSDGNPFGGAKSIAQTVGAVIGKVEGGQNNEGASQDSQSKRGQGWVLINGEPRAHAHCNLKLVNARPGVDGNYYVSEAEHNYTRGVGYTTRCNVQNFVPQEGDYNWKRKTKEQVAATKEEEEKKKAEEAKVGKEAYEENYIKERAENPLIPGRAPMDRYWGYWHNNDPSELDIRAAMAWYKRWEIEPPPRWKEQFAKIDSANFDDRFPPATFEDRWGGLNQQ
jgi:hypothetical protein